MSGSAEQCRRSSWRLGSSNCGFRVAPLDGRSRQHFIALFASEHSQVALVPEGRVVRLRPERIAACFARPCVRLRRHAGVTYGSSTNPPEHFAAAGAGAQNENAPGLPTRLGVEPRRRSGRRSITPRLDFASCADDDIAARKTRLIPKSCAGGVRSATARWVADVRNGAAMSSKNCRSVNA